MTGLVDTQILLWSFFDDAKLTPAIKDILLDERNLIYYSPVSLWEISIKYGLGKLVFLVLFAGLWAALATAQSAQPEREGQEPAPYYLGMTLDELLDMDLYNTPFQITAQYAIEDGPDAGGRAVWMSETCLRFNADGILYAIEGPPPRLDTPPVRP